MDLRTLAERNWTPGDSACPICHRADGFHDQTLHPGRQDKK